MWELKTDCKGKDTSAVKRRLTKYKVDLTSAKSRVKFGYNYLIWIKESTNG